MSARALCPECGRVLDVRTDDRLPKHWSSPRAQLAGQDRCPGSTAPTRHWREDHTASGPVRVKRRKKKGGEQA